MGYTDQKILEVMVSANFRVSTTSLVLDVIRTTAAESKAFKRIGGNNDMNLRQKKIIAAMKFVIDDLKKNWGADCKDLDTNWWAQGGYSSYRAQKVIEFLQENIEMIRENV